MPVMVSVFQIANPEYASIVSFSVLFLYPLWTPLLLFVSVFFISLFSVSFSVVSLSALFLSSFSFCAAVENGSGFLPQGMLYCQQKGFM